MKKIKSIAIAIIMMIAGTAISYAHEEKGPHGGQMIDASNGYHAELLNKDGKVTVYLLDDKAKPMSNKGITGSVILQFADKTSATVALTASGDDGFAVVNEKADKFSTCIVTFKVNGKSVTAKFKAGKTEEHQHKKGEEHHHKH